MAPISLRVRSTRLPLLIAALTLGRSYEHVRTSGGWDGRTFALKPPLPFRFRVLVSPCTLVYLFHYVHSSSLSMSFVEATRAHGRADQATARARAATSVLTAQRATDTMADHTGWCSKPTRPSRAPSRARLAPVKSPFPPFKRLHITSQHIASPFESSSMHSKVQELIRGRWADERGRRGPTVQRTPQQPVTTPRTPLPPSPCSPAPTTTTSTWSSAQTTKVSSLTAL